MTRLLQESSERWRKRIVDQEPHSLAARGSARSRTASAAKSSASRTSSASRSGYSARMPSVVCPSATGNDSRNWNPKTAKTQNSPSGGDWS